MSWKVEIESIARIADMATECALGDLGAVDGEELEAFWAFAEDCGEYIPFELY